MQSTSRLRVLSDRIPQVLVFVYFCRRLSGIIEERPTRRDYIEILTCRAIFYRLEDSRSHENEAEAERSLAQGARPPSVPNQSPLRVSCSTNLKDQGQPFNQCRFDPTTHIHLEGLYNQTPWPLEESTSQP